MQYATGHSECDSSKIQINRKAGAFPLLIFIHKHNQGLSCVAVAGGLHVVDVNDPLNPTFAGCYGGDGYVHDAECLVYDGPDTRFNGREVNNR